MSGIPDKEVWILGLPHGSSVFIQGFAQQCDLSSRRRLPHVGPSQKLLGAPWDIVTASNWDYNLTFYWGNLCKPI